MAREIRSAMRKDIRSENEREVGSEWARCLVVVANETSGCRVFSVTHLFKCNGNELFRIIVGAGSGEEPGSARAFPTRCLMHTISKSIQK